MIYKYKYEYKYMIFAISYGDKLVIMLFPRNNKEIKVNQNTEQKIFL